MSNNRHKNKCKHGDRKNIITAKTRVLAGQVVSEDTWFTRRRKRNRRRDRIAKASRRRNR